MSRIIIQHASVLTLDDRDTFLFPATVVIDDDVITGIFEEGAKLEQYNDAGPATVIDGTDKLVMPGLVDLHFHTSVAKGYNDTLPLWEYLDTVWYPSIRSLTPSTARTAALHSYITALKSGTTTVNDMYRFVPSLASAAEAVGIRAVLSNDVALPEHRLDSLADNLDAFRQCDGAAKGRVKVWMGVEWIPLADEAMLRDVARAKAELGCGVHIHLCESLSEVANSASRFGGRTPVQVARDAGLLGPDCVAAHCVHLSADDIQLLADTGTHVSYNPGSNAKLGNGVARLQDLLKAGVNVGLGVDACECHNSTDMSRKPHLTYPLPYLYKGPL
ncbi:hypothetical protein B0J12DRAFT_777239 [Macrophomina phaseolina]|uniref:Amidohydrolase-related domain-containing protein n=1 Tax=Macrophomina phaseolina TaxID=35725 RepID=A0ABQ8FQU6_9PEZI|nr:hypothetical protein B0J12DRAFT_777239 [Macrophomina phaseolina]